MRESLLQVRGLQVVIRGLTVVDGLEYDLAHGETLGIVGESGCGKTIAALALLKLTPTGTRIGGCVNLAGQDLLALDEYALQQVRGSRIAMIFQEPMTALNPVLTVADQVAEMFILHQRFTRSQALAAAHDALARVRIADPNRCGCDYPHQLSGGMRQRVMIAMALACQPQLLIADEPTTALDVTVQAQILDLILEIQEELGMAVLFISHNLGVISQVADRVMVMYAGRAVECADADTLLHEPHHPYTQALLATLPKIGDRRTRLPAIPGTVPQPGNLIVGCSYAPRCPLADGECQRITPPFANINHSHGVACHKALQACIAEPVGLSTYPIDLQDNLT